MRLIFENSTVCLISRRISLLCPVDIDVVLAGPLGLVGVGVAVSLTIILARSSALVGGLNLLVLFSQGTWLLLIVAGLALVGLVHVFRWRV